MTRPTTYTVFGADGFVGRRLAEYLAEKGETCRGVTRANVPPQGTHVGHCIYAIGVTADFRRRPFDAVAAHVTRVAEVLQGYQFKSFLYLSSTRLYRGSETTCESAELHILPADPERLYDATKLAGEALCLSLSNPAVRVARLSNVFGAGDRSANFLTQVLREAQDTNAVVIRSTPQSAKDYVHLDDACVALCEIARCGRERIYNVASGRNVSNAEIAGLVALHTRAAVSFAPNAADVGFPEIDVRRLASEFPWRPRQLEQHFRELVLSRGAHNRNQSAEES